MDLWKNIPQAAFASAICALATALVFLPSLQNDFVNFDDTEYILENALIGKPILQLLHGAFFDFYYLNWHPLTIISYAIDHYVWGLDPFGYHLTNLVLHSINTFLTGILAGLLLAAADTGKKQLFSFIFPAVTALLFGIHPLHVESVAWISSRKDVLSGLFFLLTLIFYLRYSCARRGALAYLASLVSFFLAVMSKPAVIMLPAALIILDYYPLKRQFSFRSVLLEKAPFMMIAAFSASMTLFAQTTRSAFTSSIWDRLLVSARAYVFYLEKVVLPLDFAPFYPVTSDPGPSSPEYMFSIAVLLSITVFCVLKRMSRVYTAAFAFYIVTLLPVIGVIQISSHLAADRYMYLPSLAPFMLAGIGAGLLSNSRSGTKVVLTACLALFVFLALVSKRQIGVWKDSVSLWSHEIKQYPSVYLAYNNRAAAFMKNGDYMSAIADLKKAISLSPEFISAYINLGDIYRRTGRNDLALEVYGYGIEMNNGDAELLFERGVTYNRLGQFTNAVDDFTAVLEKGYHAGSAIHRAIALTALGELDHALHDLTEALKREPGNALAHYSIAQVHLRLSNTELALHHSREAAALGYGRQAPW